jgi:phenylalanyl-tRNA synthetase beta chain
MVEKWDLAGRPVDASMDVDRLLDLVPERTASRMPPAAQPVDRDLAVVVDEATSIGELLRVARMSAGPLLDELHLFDVYRGDQVGDGRVSYAIAMRFQPAEAGDERAVDKALNKVRGSLRHHLGAEIR